MKNYKRTYSRNTPTMILGLAMLLIVNSVCCSSNDNRQEIHGYDEFQWIAPGLTEDDIPFEFVFPTYLPEGIDNRPLLKGIFPDSHMENIAQVTIDYVSKEDDPVFNISVMETNVPEIRLPDPNKNKDCTGIVISNIDVVEGESDMQIFTPDGTTWFERGLEYDWIQSPLYYSVTIHGYERDECLNVIESIIQQR